MTEDCFPQADMEAQVIISEVTLMPQMLTEFLLCAVMLDLVILSCFFPKNGLLDLFIKSQIFAKAIILLWSRKYVGENEAIKKNDQLSIPYFLTIIQFPSSSSLLEHS